MAVVKINNIHTANKCNVDVCVDPCIIVQFVKINQQDATVYQNFIIPYLYEAQHVSATHRPSSGA
jgi:hypothetical protein